MSTSDLRELLKRSLLRIEELEASLEEQTLAAREPIAIIGLGCRFPGGGSDPQAFWSSLLRGVDAIGEIPPARWPASFPRPTQPAARWGGLLEQIDQFDAEFFQISPREAVSMDPQQRLLLEVAWEAMEDAGQLPEQLVGSRTGVFVGIMNLDYKERFIVGDPQLLDLYCFLGNGLSEAPGRLSYVLGLQGPCMAVDTACSSSLVAVHLACQSLRRGESTLALAGGVHLILSPLMMEMMSRTQGLSPDGRCKTFDARANGMVRAEGCGVLILKRLADARRDGDPIRAVLRGSAVNQDGGSSGFTVPNVLSQEALLRQALDSAGVAASQISYVEAHGTGTPLGDPIEMEALKRVLGQPRADDSQCAVSSVKTNLGHLEAAAGVAGLIKTVLALQHGRIPRHLHLQTLNPRISLAGTPLVIPVQERAFNAPPGPRLAGVSSFGVSGINAHAIVEEAPAPPSAEAPAPLPRDHVLTLSGRTEAALRAMAERYVQFLQPTASAPAAPAAAATTRTGWPWWARRKGSGWPPCSSSPRARRHPALRWAAPSRVSRRASCSSSRGTARSGSAWRSSWWPRSRSFARRCSAVRRRFKGSAACRSSRS
jgi:acyl transferase domain-containing protein